MKKVLLIAVMLLSQGLLLAQTPTGGMDTIYARNPTYLYLKGWADPYDSIQPRPYLDRGPTVYIKDGQPNYFIRWGRTGGHISEHAFLYEVDTPLNVIGAAVGAAIFPGMIPVDWQLENDLEHWAEYLKIYLHVHDTMILARQKEFNILDTTRWMYSYPGWYTPYGPGMGPNNNTRYFPIYEVYFDKPLTVTDSFYLAVTNRFKGGGDSVYDQASGQYLRRVFQEYYALYNLIYVDTSARHLTREQRDSMYAVDDAVLVSRRYPEADGTMHEPGWRFNDPYWSFGHIFPHGGVGAYIARPFLFPIIDTTGMGLHAGTPCRKVTTLRLASKWDRSALFTWEGSDFHNRYELAVGKAEYDPSIWTSYRTNATSKIMNYLDSNVLYGARVRAECTPKGNYSDWSDTIHFRLNDVEVQGIGSYADKYTYLMPNPAHDWVQVVSSFGLQGIVIYDLNGREVLAMPAEGHAGSVDVSKLPAGTYLAVITTSGGTTMKRLTVVR